MEAQNSDAFSVSSELLDILLQDDACSGTGSASSGSGVSAAAESLGSGSNGCSISGSGTGNNNMCVTDKLWQFKNRLFDLHNDTWTFFCLSLQAVVRPVIPANILGALTPQKIIIKQRAQKWKKVSSLLNMSFKIPSGC